MKLIKLKEVVEVTGLSKSWIYSAMRVGNFPRPIQIGQRRVAWKKSDIEKWIEDRPAA
ncbi:MAG: AlpA family transcriptional regulator [Gammaproteobacteria bacterium]|nr:AlpA family transcriptional regulator [Gammaproteobacteria bacterium]MDH5692895.1 AlpA family transcriptional regulator [Gammaproteobacteria bacterium]